MATMLNGAAVMDGALLLIAANESCPQPQTSEHLAAVEIMRLKHIIILQNKIDLIRCRAPCSCHRLTSRKQPNRMHPKQRCHKYRHGLVHHMDNHIQSLFHPGQLARPWQACEVAETSRQDRRDSNEHGQLIVYLMSGRECQAM